MGTLVVKELIKGNFGWEYVKMENLREKIHAWVYIEDKKSRFHLKDRASCKF